ncbi:hypothetical protein J3A83DRAFT_3488219 [Scleroderma citrinum]
MLGELERIGRLSVIPSVQCYRSPFVTSFRDQSVYVRPHDDRISCTFTLLALIFLWRASMYYCDSTFPSLVSPFLDGHHTVCFARLYPNECLASGFSKARPFSGTTLGSLAVGTQGSRHRGAYQHPQPFNAKTMVQRTTHLTGNLHEEKLSSTVHSK